MKAIEKLLLWKDFEYEYPLSFGFIPNVHTYIHEDNQIRPAMLVVPGGGYSIVSPTEAEIVARRFYKKGFQVFILTYTTNLFMTQPLGLQPLWDLSRAVRMVRARAADFCVDPQRIVICGFSAGAHLCGSLCVHFDKIEEKSDVYSAYSNRPDAAILSYPVITAEEEACHVGSYLALYGLKEECSVFSANSLLCSNASLEEIQFMSLEKHVTKNTPPCFLWQTATDEAVSVKNSYLFAEALQRNGVLYAHHVFSTGKHGHLAGHAWESRQYGELYTLEQSEKVVNAYKQGLFSVKEEAYATHCIQMYDNLRKLCEVPEEELNDEVSPWPELVQAWLSVQGFPIY